MKTLSMTIAAAVLAAAIPAQAKEKLTYAYLGDWIRQQDPNATR